MKRARRASDNIHLEPISFYVTCFGIHFRKSGFTEADDGAAAGVIAGGERSWLYLGKIPLGVVEKETGRLAMLP